MIFFIAGFYSYYRFSYHQFLRPANVLLLKVRESFDSMVWRTLIYRLHKVSQLKAYKFLLRRFIMLNRSWG
jgi:hypothetical protein